LSVIILVFSFVSFLFIGVPVAFSMLFSSILYIVVNGSPAYIFVIQRLSSGLDSFTLLAIPLFIIAANLMNELSISTKIFNFAAALVGHFKGGLAYVNVLASLIFSGMSGSSAADFGGLGNIEIKAMNKQNYPRAFSAAVTAASSSIGPVFPPSVMLVLFGVMTKTSIGKLFIGGIIPGILMTITLMIAIRIESVNRDFPTKGKFSFRGAIKSFGENFFALVTPVMLLFFLITGIVTPSELGIILIIYSILVGFIYKTICFIRVKKALIDSVYLTGQILFMIAAASVFGNIIVREDLPKMLFNFMERYSLNGFWFLTLSGALLLILGCFMEGLSLEILAVPLLVPVANALGVDVVQLGILMILAIEIGLITPPMGMGVYITSDIAKVSATETFRESIPFLYPLIAVLLLVIIFPGLVLWLPSLFFG